MNKLENMMESLSKNIEKINENKNQKQETNSQHKESYYSSDGFAASQSDFSNGSRRSSNRKVWRKVSHKRSQKQNFDDTLQIRDFYDDNTETVAQ